MEKQNLISVVIPVYKCENCLEDLSSRLVLTLEKINPLFEVVFVNDGGGDAAWNIIEKVSARDPRFKGLDLSRNFGQHNAITAGMDFADAQWFVVMDGDLQDCPEDIEKLYEKTLQGYDIVYARRAVRHDGIFKKLSSSIFHAILKYAADTTSNENIGNFGIYSQKVIQNFRKIREQTRAFPFAIKWLGFKHTYVDVAHEERAYGKSAYNLFRLFSLAADIIISYSNKPLKLSIQIGVFFSISAALYVLYIVVRYFVEGIPVQGWASLIASLYLIFGLLLVQLGVLGIYIGKIFEETKQRPLYAIRSTVGLDKKTS